jgi:hypothetical protein
MVAVGFQNPQSGKLLPVKFGDLCDVNPLVLVACTPRNVESSKKVGNRRVTLTWQLISGIVSGPWVTPFPGTRH